MEIRLNPDASWYAEGARWIAALWHGAGRAIDGPSCDPVEPMPRHTSFEEVLADARNRAHIW